MSDTCYELFEVYIERAHTYSRQVIIEFPRFRTSWEYICILFEIRSSFKNINNLMGKALNTNPRKVLNYPTPVGDPKKLLEDALDKLKKTGRDCLRIKQKLMAIIKKWPFLRTWYSVVLGQLPEKLFDNIETLYFVTEAALEEEGKYVSADDILASLS